MMWYRSAAVSAALVLALLPASAVADETTSTTTATAAPRVMVVGDSISAGPRYGPNHASPPQIKAWWARLGFAKVPEVDAYGGSGMVSSGATPGDTTGATCKENRTFLDRIGNIDATKTDVLIVEGGRNDFKLCVNGKVRRATTHQAAKAIKKYMETLRAKVDAPGSVLTPKKVYVMSPWGTTFTSQRSKIAPLVEQYAKASGFQWIMLPALAETYTIDGTHPNNRGAQRLADLVLANSNIDGSSASRGVSVSCTGVSGCRKKDSRYAKASYRDAIDHRYWSQPYGPRNYVAYRLTHGGRVTERPDARVPSTWKDAAVKGGQRASSEPTVGSIAWWPAGVIDARGHIAYVEQVNSDASKVWVSEIVGTHTYRRTSYSASSFPRAFLNFRKSKGSPFGKVTSAESTRHNRLTVAGYASDPDAYATGVKVIVKVTQGDRTRTFQVSGRPRFAFSTTLRVREGKVTVRAWAYNAPGSKGTSKVYLGGRRARVS